MRKTFVFRSFALLVLFLMFLPLGADQNVQAQPVSALEAQEGGDRVQAYYVWYAEGQRVALRNRLSSMQAKVTHVFDPQLVPAMVVLLPESQAKTLVSSSDVAFMEPVPEHWLLEDAPMPLLTDAPTNGVMAPTNPQVVPWNIDMVQARDVWDVDRDGVVDPGAPDGSGVRFCIIDTGFYRAHDDFQGIVSSGWSQISGENWWEDGNGHGTHVAGTANAVNNSFGVVGVMPGGAQLLIVKIFNNNGAWVTGQSNLGTAAQWCRDNGANAISMSLGGGYSATENNIFQGLYDNNNIISIAAAGNDGNTTRSYPASYDSVISVAALQSNEVVASFSQFPPTSYNPLSPPANVLWDVVELSGGGEGVLSTVPYVNGDVPMYQITADGNTYSGYHVEESGYTSSSGITALLANGNLCDTTNAAWNSRIVLCERGSVSFAIKINNVRSSGGLGVAIYNNVPGNFGATCGGACTQPSIPAISLSQEDGQALLPSVGNSSTLIVYDGSDCVDCTGGYDYMSGTSMATPGVAAGVAWVWDSCGGPTGITNQQLRQLLRDSAKDLAGTRHDEGGTPYTYGTGYDVHSGWGVIQLADALALGGERYGWGTCPPPGPFVIEPTPTETTICSLNTNQTVFDLNVGGKDFEGWIDLNASGYPIGATANFAHDPIQVTPVGDWEATSLTIGNLNGAASGIYPMTISGVDQADADNTFATDVTLSVYAALPGVAGLISPASGSINVPRDVIFSWEPAVGAETYTLQIATSSDFTQGLQEFVGLTSTTYAMTLEADTVYYWRVRAENPCGQGSHYEGVAFRTEAVTCPTYGPGATGDILDYQGNSPRTTTFNLSVPDSGTVTDLDVVNLAGTHTYISDLSFALDSPAGTRVQLIPRMCGNAQNFHKTLDDEAANSLACPLSDGATQQPYQPLSAYDGQNRAGTWVLRITDNVRQDSGTLTGWYLRICTGSVYHAVCGNLPASYGMACHRALTGSTLRLGDTWGDQNGIQFDVFKAGENAQVQVNVQGTPTSTPYLRVWFDWDSDGIFDTSDVVYSGDVVVGTNTLDTIPVPGTLTAPVNYRFRLYDGVPIGLMALDNYSYGDVDGGDITDGESPDPTPTAVTIASFTATPQGNAILVTWETASELNNIGFNLYRSEWVAGPYVQLNNTLIPPQNPGTVLGGVYEWLDVAVRSGTTYYYKLEDIDIHGIRTFHEPVWAVTSAPPYRVYLPIVLRP